MKVLAYRFSAFGDVIMAATVVREMMAQNPNLELLFVSRLKYGYFFEQIPRVEFIGLDLDEKRGLGGLYTFFKNIRAQHKIDAVADLHNVIRSKFLTRLFSFHNIPVQVINKGKEEKENLTAPLNVSKTPLKSTVERYADVFRELGIKIQLSQNLAQKNGNTQRKGIGFSPFAQHIGKMLPLAKSELLLRALLEKDEVYLFGGGPEEIEVLENWSQKFPNAYCVAGTMGIEQEVDLISHLKVMISMDSANMHLASWAGTRCISIWCATHPFAGFLGYGQQWEDAVGQDDLTCRPCSVFGNKACFRGDYACKETFPLQRVLDLV